MRIVFISFFIILLSGCSSHYANQSHVGIKFPAITGTSLEQKEVNIPHDFQGEKTLLLIGYKQDSQFDIDRWLIGLDMTATNVNVYELPTISGMFPRMFSTVIDNGMRAGIPKELWKGVITVYQDGDKVQLFTGNETPNNARVILLDENGVILYMYDDGFSVTALKTVNALVSDKEH